MLVDGRKIADDIRGVLKNNILALHVEPTLGIVVVGNNPVIESFVRIKKKFGETIGVRILEFRFSEDITGESLRNEVAQLSERGDIDGLIVQLPLPDSINVQSILDAVSIIKDVDMLSQKAIAMFAQGEAKLFPPVAGAIQEILERHQVVVVDKEILILGFGRLVGKPVSILLRHNSAHVTVIDRPVSDLGVHVKESSIIISGVGVPGIIRTEMISPHMVIIDAGTSESGGKIVGDAEPKCADVAALFTPVPGGVGPIAVAMLFKNLVLLTKMHHESK